MYSEYIIYEKDDYHNILCHYDWSSDAISEKFVDMYRGKELYSLPSKVITCEQDLLEEMPLTISKNQAANVENTATCEGLVFVVTGSLENFENREEFTECVEDNGGSVASDISKNTDFLVNNDADPTSSKNNKAKELGIPIISEDKFIELFADN